MRRAVIATAGTVVGIVVLLGYKSSGPVNLQRVSTGTGAVGATTTTGPASASTTVPSGASPTTSTAAKNPASSSGTRTYTGQLVTYLYGNIQVAATLAGRRIDNVTVPQNSAMDGRSAMINSEAVPILIQEALAAQGTNFDVVSGATYTSDAFAQSLQSALSEAGQ